PAVPLGRERGEEHHGDLPEARLRTGRIRKPASAGSTRAYRELRGRVAHRTRHADRIKTMNDEQQSTQTSPAPRGSGARAATIALAVFGGVVLLGAGGTAALAATHDVRDAARHGGSLSQSQAVDV